MRILDVRGNPFAPGAQEVRDHRRLERAAEAVVERLLEATPTEALEDMGATLGLLGGDGRLHVPHEEAVGLLFDCCAHDWIDEEGGNLVRDLANAAAEMRLPEAERIVLDAMLRPRTSLFRIEEHWPGAGVRVWDAIGDGQLPLLDSEFGRGPDRAGAWFVARIIEPRSWCMTTGAPVLLGNYRGDDLDGMLGTLRATRRACASEHEMSMTLAELAVKVITGRSGPERGFEVALRERDDVARPARAARPPGRNDPCPCGSGRKYKKCCARVPRR